ncbi:MAG: type III secretion system chaperone [Pseudomonadota bacterium]
MIDTAEFTEQLADIGPILGEAMIAETEDREAWQIVLEAAQITIEPDHDRDCLIFSSDLGSPPPDKSASFYAFALRVNNMWPFTGGIYLGLDAESEEITLFSVLPVSGLDSQRLAAMVVDFAERRVAWASAVVQGGPAEVGEMPEGTVEDASDPRTIIRG